MGKIIQMFDVFNIRFGATLVGPTGAGKTTCYRVLAAVMTDLRNKGSVNPEFQVILLLPFSFSCYVFPITLFRQGREKYYQGFYLRHLIFLGIVAATV